MRCEFLKGHRGGFGPIREAYGILRVPKSEYHGYVKRRKSDAQIEREALEGFVAERFDFHKGRYGYRRINRELRCDDIVVSEKRVLAVMRKLGLQAKGGEQEAQTREGGRDGRPAREPRGQGVRRRSPQQAMGARHHLHRDGRRTALPPSRDRRVPQEGRGLVDVRAHDREAGRGCARAGGRKGEPSRPPRPRLPRRSGFPARVPGVPALPRILWDRPRPGSPWDDALPESFFETLKRELVNGKGYKTREEAKQDLFTYIEPCYSRRRMHSSIGYNAPCDLERDVA